MLFTHILTAIWKLVGKVKYHRGVGKVTLHVCFGSWCTVHEIVVVRYSLGAGGESAGLENTGPDE